MGEQRITPLLGPALVAYLIADRAALQGGLDAAGKLVTLCAIGLSLLLFWGARSRERRGAVGVGWLGFGAGLSLVPVAAPEALSLSGDLAAIAGHALCAGVLVDLALRVPDRVPGYGGRRTHALMPLVPTGLAAVAALSVAAPRPLTAIGFVPPAWLDGLSAITLAAALGATLWLRHRRSTLGSRPGALAANGWGVLGTWPAALCLAWLLGTGSGAALLSPHGPLTELPVTRGALPGPAQLRSVARALWVCMWLALAWSHVRLVDPRERLRVGAATRTGVSLALTCGAMLGVAWLWLPQLPVAARAALLWAIPLWLLGLLIWRAVAPVVRRALAPAGGALLDALAAAQPTLGRARHFEEFARDVLSALRAASADPFSQPWLVALDPARRATIDAAGQVQVDQTPISPILLAHVQQAPGEIVLRNPLQAQEVRRPDLRPLVEVLAEHDALCVVPLVDDGELEGLLVLPRGLRRSSLTLEELQALRDFAARVAAHLASLGAEARAQLRAGDALLESERAAERIEQLQDEVARLRADARVLRAGRAADRARVPPVAYGPAMRRLLTRLDALAVTDAPLLLIAEGGTPVEAMAYQTHARGGRAEEAFVVADCAAIQEGDAATTLFGGGAPGEPGLLRLAAGGTLVLLDLPALPLGTQAQLAEVLASRRASGTGGPDSYEVTARVVATARAPLTEAVEAGRFDPELAARIAPSTLAIPPLRERPEDMESLLLMALDRASRLFGREAVGIDPEAQAVLMGHDWPGNQRELQSVVDRAVRTCDASRVGVAHLPPLPGADAPAPAGNADALDGSLETVERRALQRALEEAGGNKSEAARRLGLKRTTFLDKLRRHGLEEGGRPSSPPN